ncbi:hypothetical protein, partial [Escherichia coli]|uniref:hypothetical protein n=1 Tax=Escherichia coli TaxID=562 RepID=UPI000A5787C4
LKTSIKTITYLSDTGCLEIQGASLENINSFNFCMSLDKPVIQPSEQNRGPKDGPKAFKQLCIENPLRL